MANTQRLTFLFMSVTATNLESLHERSSSPDQGHFFHDTVRFYEEFLIARDTGHKLLMVKPGDRESYEIDDQEEPGMHIPRGFVTVITDLSKAHAVATRGGFIATENMLTHAFILRERVIDAIRKGWRVAFYKEGENSLAYHPDKRFALLQQPGPTTLQ